jgi:hypothetical protein
MPIRGMDDVKKAIAKTKRDANENIMGVYLSGLGNIVAETPADTGVTRNSWFLTVGTPFSLLGARNGSDSGAGSVASIGTMPDWVLNKKIYYTNNRPQITLLEYGGYPNPVKNGSWIDGKYQKLSSGGFSKQAPGGWVRSTLIKMQNKIRSL